MSTIPKNKPYNKTKAPSGSTKVPAKTGSKHKVPAKTSSPSSKKGSKY